MAQRIMEQVRGSSEARLLISQQIKGRGSIKTLISRRDLPILTRDQLQNIIVRARKKHFVLRFESYGGAIHDKYERDYHLL